MREQDIKFIKTNLVYNCGNCEQYWKDNLKFFKGLGNDVEFLKLSCPSCQRQRKLIW
jgi:hypothetical protein